MRGAALIMGSRVLTWPGVFVALGALCAMLGCAALYLARDRDARELAGVLPAAVLFSLVLGRLVHWFCHPLMYTGFAAAMTNYFQGGFSLSGAFAGTLLAVGFCCAGELVRHPTDLLDAMAPAAALGIGVGRLGSMFDLSDRGRMLVEAPERQHLPFAALTEQIPGSGEWRFATFFIQALAAFALAAILCWAFFRFTRRMRRGEDLGGCVFALFLAMYGAAQVVLDSTRYDADFFRFNGFVHLTQVLAAAAVALSAAWLSVRAVKKTGLRPWHWGCWAALAGGMGLAGYMEYYVQRRADQVALGYGLMSGGMALAGAACVLLCVGRNRAARKGKRSIGPEEI